MDFQLIDSTRMLEQAAADLAGSEVFFIDTEFEQRGGSATLCLLQISAGKRIYLIDMLHLSALDVLTKAITGENSIWVIHSAKMDVELLADKLQLTHLPPVFDTQVAWGLLGAEYSVALAYLNYRVLGLRMTKEHQADPWAKRPLPQSQLVYAAEDIVTLPQLYQALRDRLERDGKWDLVFDVTEEFCFPPLKPKVTRSRVLTIEDFRNAWQLDYAGLAALQFLINWWNGLASEQRPSGLNYPILFNIARRLPESGSELAQIKGVPRHWAREQGDLLTGRLIRASYEASEERFPPLDPKPYLTYDEAQWEAFVPALKYAVSRMVNIAPEICFPTWSPPELLREQAMQNGSLESGAEILDGWRKQWLTDPYQKFCKRWEHLVSLSD
jgi:ribonuclease D